MTVARFGGETGRLAADVHAAYRGETQPMITVKLETQEKLQLAMDGLLGVREALANRKIRPFRGILEAYECITGDFGGRNFDRGAGTQSLIAQTSQAIAVADFPNILLNAMSKKLIQDYLAIGLGGLEKAFVKTQLTDYKLQKRPRMGYLADLPAVAEADPYTELTKPTDEIVSYSAAKKGGILTISEETIRNDDLGAIMGFTDRLARAGIRTLKQFVTDFYVNNPDYDVDSVAWFHATHGNLGSVALSSAELDARQLALRIQPEKDSAKKLGLPLDWIMVAPNLEGTARQINRSDSGTNSWCGKFGQRDEGIIVNELLADTNDWFYGSDAAPSLEIGFRGSDAPSIVIANQASQGKYLSNDQFVYKVNFEFGGNIVDFRGVGKNVVA